MKQIIALQNYTDKYISLYEGQIRIVEANLANRLIAKGIAAEHDEISACCYNPNSASTSVQSNIIVVDIEDIEDSEGEILLIEREKLLSAIEADKTIFAKHTTTTGNSPYLRRQNELFVLVDSYPAMQSNVLVYNFIFESLDPANQEGLLGFYADQSRTYPISTTLSYIPPNPQ